MSSSPHWVPFQHSRDARGGLTAIEADAQAPFPIRRVFYIHNVSDGTARGGHANLESDQLLTAVSGSLKIDLSDGVETRTFVLDDPTRGVVMPRMHWIRLYDFSRDAVCLVLASTLFDAKEYIRSWSDFLERRGLPLRPEPGAAKD